MNASDSPVLSEQTLPRTLLNATALILITGFAGDCLFWRAQPGVSVGVFFVLLAIGLLMVGKYTAGSIAALVLLVACAVQSGTELCFTNVTLLATLLLYIFGAACFPSIQGSWGRWSEAAFAVLRGPLRWSALLRDWAHSRFVLARSQQLRSPTLARFVVAVAPAAAVGLVFAILLSAGNAVLAQLARSFLNSVEHWLLDLSIPRTMLFLGWLTLGVAFFWPAPPNEHARWWTRAIPLWIRRDPTLALWQNIALLAAVNVVFFAANTSDAIFLWWHATLPEGVSYSQFVHQGVYSLITAVVFAAGVLAIVFQQQPSIAHSPIVRGMALAWTLQNLALIAGVLRRLQLYVETYQYSELRVYVGCFLLLVTVGFLLLAHHIHRGMQLGKLIRSNALVTLLLFFIVQYCDVATWVAQRNVAQWKADSRRILDLTYLESLGPCGWPALAEVAQDPRGKPESDEATRILRIAVSREMISAKEHDWRSYQHRRHTRIRWLLENYTPL